MKVINRCIYICLLLLGASRARAATVEVCLRVDQFQIGGPVAPATAGPFGNPAPIPMWGFIQTGTGASCTFVGATNPTVSSHQFPTVTAVEGDTLIIHLLNNLPAASASVYTEPVSVVIPGQRGDFTPTWNAGLPGNRTSSTQRVRSFTKETPQQNTTPVNYTFGPLKAGTFLIESGTHPAVQVQMGLYGVLRVRPTIAGRAYADPTSAFDSEVTLLLSEIDPVVHAAIASGQYGPAPTDPPPTGWLTSSIEYHPKYFLINGRPFTTGSSQLSIGGFNRRALIRFLNAGLDTKVPVVQGRYLSIIAEDGNFLSANGFTGSPPNQVPASCPAPKSQYSVLLPAGKTMDAILVTPPVPGAIPVYDRRLHLTNNGSSPGGMLANLLVTAAGGGANPPAPPPPCALVGSR